MATSVLSFRVDAAMLQQLDRLAQATERDRQYHLKRALTRYLEEEHWHLEAIAEGIADADAGRLTDLDTLQQQWGRREQSGQPD